MKRTTRPAPSARRRRSIAAARLAVLVACLFIATGLLADERGQPPRGGAGAGPPRRPRRTHRLDRWMSWPIAPRRGIWRPGRDCPASTVPTPSALQTVVLFGVVSLAPVGLLMLTAFVRISIVLTLLRQALGSPQVPGNQIIMALSLMLTALVMWPTGDRVYRDAIEPYAAKKLDAVGAWNAGVGPVKAFMIEQILLTKHQGYLESLQGYSTRQGSEPVPERLEDYPLRVVAPAFLLSELTTALLMGFYLYLPFLVVDLVVSSILAATGLFMLPPVLVATPIKLILFVLADGWFLVATMLLTSFGMAGAGR